MVCVFCSVRLRRHRIRELIGTTPTKGYRSRSDEILAWLEAHPHIESFVVLDDMDLSVPHGASFAKYLVRTDENSGFGKADADRALEILRQRADRSLLPRAGVSRNAERIEKIM